MKTLGLVLALVALVGGSCLAQTTTVTIPITVGTTNLISLPCVPIDPAVGGSQSGADASGVFGAFKTNTGFQLTQWNTAAGGYMNFNSHAPATFGNLLLGTGYWVTGASLTGNITYTALPDGVPNLNSSNAPLTDSTGAIECTDMYISLPGQGLTHGGTQIIGLPFAHNVAINSAGDYTGERILFTNGSVTQTWSQANAAGWVSSTLADWNATAGGYVNVGYGHGKGGVLYPGDGYWITTLVDNIAMIIPGKEDGLQ